MKTLAVITIFSLTTGFVAQAQEIPDPCPDKPVDEASARALAGTWFNKGVQLADDKKFGEAVEAFTCSIHMVEHPATLFNGAKAAREAGEFGVAVKMLQRIIDLNPDPDMTGEAKLFLKEVREEQAEREPAPVPKPEPKPNPQPMQERPKETAEEPVPFGQPDQDDSTDIEKESSSLRVAGYVLGSAGVAGILVGGVFQAMAGAAQTTTEETDNYNEYTSAKDDVESYQKVALAGFIAGGVLFGTGLVMILVDGKETDDTAKIDLVPTMGGLTLRGSF
jgi:hypothetical protein